MTDNETLAALAAQVDELRREVAGLHQIVVRWDARLDTDVLGKWLVLRAAVKRLTRNSAEMETEVKRLADALEEAIRKNHLAPPPAPYWLGLSRDEYLGQLAKLQEWVDRIARGQYSGYLVKLPLCWANHPEAVWELSNLMTEWERIYGDEDNRDLAAALWFFERWMPGVLARLARAIPCDEAGCRRPQQIASPS
jgi:hypothetical protein